MITSAVRRSGFRASRYFSLVFLFFQEESCGRGLEQQQQSQRGRSGPAGCCHVSDAGGRQCHQVKLSLDVCGPMVFWSDSCYLSPPSLKPHRKFHGYASLKDYYETESCVHYLHNVSDTWSALPNFLGITTPPTHLIGHYKVSLFSHWLRPGLELNIAATTWLDSYGQQTKPNRQTMALKTFKTSPPKFKKLY